ncbi:MAG TPA: hypothetical protein VFF69_04230 [Phycisphaerales bacterium]|nr:hypothetical protein [Phycisphaerales bacterium]
MARDTPPPPAAGVACIRCGYPLPDLSPTAVCPECGTPVEHTLRGDRLATAEPAYLRDLARGAGRMLLGALLVAGALAVLLGAFTLASLLGGAWSDAGWTVGAAIVLYASAVEWTRGLRLLARRETPVRGSGRHERVRAWTALCARWHPVAILAVAGAVIAEQLFGPGRALPLVRALAMALLIPMGALVCAQLVLVPWHIRLLASRIPDKKLMKSARATLVVGPVLIAGQGAEVLGLRSPVFDSLIRGVLGLTMLVWPIAMLMLLEEARGAFVRLRDSAGAPGAPEGSAAAG